MITIHDPMKLILILDVLPSFTTYISMYKAKTLREANQAYEKDYLLDAQNVTKE